MSGTQSTPIDVIIDHEDNIHNEESIKEKVTRRRLHRTTSIVRRIFQHQENGYNENEEDPRRKNIRQTELLLDLRNAILQICAHFSECNEKEHCERQICTQVVLRYDPLTIILHIFHRLTIPWASIFQKNVSIFLVHGVRLMDNEKQELLLTLLKKMNMIWAFSEVLLFKYKDSFLNC